THMFRCSHLSPVNFLNSVDVSTIQKIQTKYTACISSHFSKNAKKCFGDIDVMDTKDLSDKTINKLQKCMDENQLLVDMMDRVNRAGDLENTQYFKKYIDHIKNYESNNFGDGDQIDFQKWEQSNHCMSELNEYLNCVQTKSNYYKLSETEFEDAIQNGKTYDCFRPQKQFWYCFVSSVYGKLLYPCFKNTNWSDKAFFECGSPDVLDRATIALQRYMAFRKGPSPNYATSEKTKDLMQRFKRFSS